MLEGIFKKLTELLRSPLSPQNSKGRQELLKIFLQEFGSTPIPQTKKTLNQTEISWKQSQDGHWHLIVSYASPEMRRKFPYLRLRHKLPPVETPTDRPAPPPQIKPSTAHPASAPPRESPTPRPTPTKQIFVNPIKPPADESLKKTVVRWKRLTPDDNVACPFCGTVNKKVNGPGTKKCFSCGKYFGAI